MAVLSFMPGILYLTQPPAMTRAVQKTTKTLESSIAEWAGKTLSLGNFLRLYVGTTFSNLLLAPSKMASCYVQAISGVFLRLSGERHYGEALHRVAAADAGRCALAFDQRHLCWCSRQTALAGRHRAGAAHKLLRLSCAPFATAQTAQVAPLVGPMLLSRRQWGIDIHGNNLLLRYLAEENQKCRYLLTYSRHSDILNTRTRFRYP